MLEGFLVRRSPKGGNQMRDMIDIESTHQFKPNMIPSRKRQRAIKENFYCLVLGYVDRDLSAGDRIFIRPDELKKIYKMAKREIRGWKIF